MITVRKIVKTCHAYPAQWEGITDDDRQVYFYYRWGHLVVMIGEVGDMDYLAALRGDYVLEICHGEEYSGDIDYAQLKSLASDKIQFPDQESDKVDWQDEGSDGCYK